MHWKLGVHLILGKNSFILIWYKAFETLIGITLKLSEREKSYNEIPINEEYTIEDIQNILSE